MTTSVRIATTFFVLFAATLLVDSTAQAQYGPPSWAGSTLRGRYHYYNGPHVNFGRGRWGNGISNNGALVLNTLTTTAGAVAPQIIPVILRTTSSGGDGQTSEGPNDTVSSNVSESAQDLESLDANREARSKKLDEIEKRSLALLERLKLTDNSPLSVKGDSQSPPATNKDSNAQITLPTRPRGT